MCKRPPAAHLDSSYHSVMGMWQRPGRGGGRVTHFQIMAGFCLPSPPWQAQFAKSSIHLQTHHAPAALCSLITPKLPQCTLNNCFPALIYSNPPQCLSSSASSPFPSFYNTTSHDNGTVTKDQMFPSPVWSPGHGSLVRCEMCGECLVMNSGVGRWTREADAIWSPWVVCPV